MKALALVVVGTFAALVVLAVACGWAWCRGFESSEQLRAVEREEMRRRAERVRRRYEPERRSGMEVWN